MASVLGPTRSSVGIRYWSCENPPNDDRSMCIPFVINAVIGQHRVTIAVAIIGEPEDTGKPRRDGGEFREYIIETRDVRLCYQHLCDRDDTPRYTFKELAQSVVEEYEESCRILVAKGINDYLRDTGGSSD
jgi:hypothetical protein